MGFLEDCNHDFDSAVARHEIEDGIIGYCRDCDKPFYSRRDYRIRGDVKLCNDCFDSHIVNICSCCDSEILDFEDVLEADGWVFCENCMDRERHCCEICGGLVVDGDMAIVIGEGQKAIYICDNCGKTHRDIVKRSDENGGKK